MSRSSRSTCSGGEHFTPACWGPPPDERDHRCVRSPGKQVRDVDTFLASTTDDWRTWLAEHGRTEREVWLVIHHADSATPTVRYHEAIEHALCFGWIDSHARRHDADSSLLRFTPRSPRSTWSRVNRERAGRMIEQGLMTAAGQAEIDRARADGRWQVVPDDLTAAVPADLRGRARRRHGRERALRSLPTVVAAVDPRVDRVGQAPRDAAAADRADRRARRDRCPGQPPRRAGRRPADGACAGRSGALRLEVQRGDPAVERLRGDQPKLLVGVESANTGMPAPIAVGLTKRWISSSSPLAIRSARACRRRRR